MLKSLTFTGPCYVVHGYCMKAETWVGRVFEFTPEARRRAEQFALTIKGDRSISFIPPNEKETIVVGKEKQDSFLRRLEWFARDIA